MCLLSCHIWMHLHRCIPGFRFSVATNRNAMKFCPTCLFCPSSRTLCSATFSAALEIVIHRCSHFSAAFHSNYSYFNIIFGWPPTRTASSCSFPAIPCWTSSSHLLFSCVPLTSFTRSPLNWQSMQFPAIGVSWSAIWYFSYSSSFRLASRQECFDS